MMSIDEQAVEQAAWQDLCDRAWAEKDPIRLLDITMQITKFLAYKQERLDAAAFDEAQLIQQAQEAERKSGAN
jgi:hypothetical protein